MPAVRSRPGSSRARPPRNSASTPTPRAARAWEPIAAAVLRGVWLLARGRDHPPARRPNGGRLGLPVDFLIAADGRIVACRYGEHVHDQWSVDELLSLAAGHPAPDSTA